MSEYVVVPRLGTVYNLERAISEVQVMSGQLDPELVPKRSVAEHIALYTFEVGSLISGLCAPWYGVEIPVSIPSHEIETDNVMGQVSKYDINPGAEFTLPEGSTNVTATPDGSLPLIWVRGISRAQDQPGVVKIVAVQNNIMDAGTIKHARDISQFWGIAKGRNTQWQGSVVWIQHGNILYIWVGGLIEINAENNVFNVMAYRGPGALDPDNPNDYLDIPDQYAPLVIKGATVLCMKQSKMGGWEEKEEQVNQGIAQLSAEFEKSMGYALAKPKAEGVEH